MKYNTRAFLRIVVHKGEVLNQTSLTANLIPQFCLHPTEGWNSSYADTSKIRISSQAIAFPFLMTLPSFVFGKKDTDHFLRSCSALSCTVYHFSEISDHL